MGHGHSGPGHEGPDLFSPHEAKVKRSDSPTPTEPVTEAGRALVEFEAETCMPTCMDNLAEQVAVIETQARAGANAEIERLRAAAIRWAGARDPSDYWRGFNYALDRVAQALSATPQPDSDSLDKAWREAEAACVGRFGPELVHHNNPTKGEKRDYGARSTSLTTPYYVSAHGSTPTAALIALTNALRGSQEQS